VLAVRNEQLRVSQVPIVTAAPLVGSAVSVAQHVDVDRRTPRT